MGTFKEKTMELLGPMPERCSLDPIVESTEDLGESVRQKVTYLVEPNDRVPAYLFIPKTAQDNQLPAILAHHQHSSQFHLGKSEVAGLAGNPDQAYGLELANRGYIVLAPDAICFEERGPYKGSLETPTPEDLIKGAWSERFEFTQRLLYGSCLQAKLLWDMQRGLDYLESRPEVDSTRLGCIGHSLGGQQTLFLAALDERIKVAVSSCGFSSLEAILERRINHNFGLYIPGFLNHGDIGDLLSEVSSRPFLGLSGENDPIFPLDGVKVSFERARGRYQIGKASERLVLMTYPVTHEFSPEMRENAYKFFDQWL